MYFRKMKTDVSQSLTVKSPRRSGRTLLFLCLAVLITAVMTAPCTAKPNDVLPSDAMAAIAQAISPDLPASYDIRKTPQGYAAENRAHNINAEFSRQEVRMCDSAHGRSWAFTLTGIGYDTLKPPPPAEITAQRNRIELKRGRALTEWYLNTPLGLEQGFTLHHPPAGPNKKHKLRIELALVGTLVPVLENDRTLIFQTGAGTPVARYAGLYVTDADNTPLPARLAVAHNKLIIHTDTSRARFPVTIDPWIQQAKLTASDAAADDNFGYSVAVSGDTVAVGAPYDDDDGDSSGSAYVFVKGAGGWTQTAKLTTSDAAAGDEFGYSVAVSGDTVAVGAYQDDDGFFGSGSAYVFVKDAGGWADMTETAKLKASVPTIGDNFGRSVAVSGDTIAVGAHGDDDGGADSGAAYVFVKGAGGWADMTAETAKLTASDAKFWDVFGLSVAVSGDTVAVGATDDDDHGNRSGSAYVFVKGAGGWADMTAETAKLTASDAAAEDQFGYSVAVSGDTVAVGTNSGSAYVFVKGTGGWADMTAETAKLTASDAVADDKFGTSVAVSGDTVAVGAFLDDDGGDASGSAYVFVKGAGAWADMTETAKLTASDAAANDNFGTSVAVSGDTVVVGAPYDDDDGPDSGSAYMFGITEINLKQGADDITNGGNYDFGSQITGSGTDAVFTIENTGTSADLTLTTPLTLGGADPGEFAVVNQPTATVAPGASTTFTVRFSPASAGVKTASISIDNNDDDENPYVLNLQGTGTVEPDPEPEPGPEPDPAAAVTGVTSIPASASYSIGTVIEIWVRFSQTVWVSGTPHLLLAAGGNVPGTAYYSSGSGTAVLTFLYTVTAGDDLSDLDCWSQWSLELNGGRIWDNMDNDAVLTLAAPGEPGSLGYNTALSILGTVYPVYRFYSPGLSKHLFTADENEKAHLLANAADIWNYEGIAYYAYLPEQYDAAPRLQKSTLRPVYRFYSQELMTHLFTIDENEKNHLMDNAADVWRYEGIAFYIPGDFKEGALPVYRFYSETLRVHLFTADENEKNHLIDTAGDMWRFEGIAYYAYP